MARQLLVDGEYDLVMINAPLIDETGEQLAKDIANSSSQAILFVKADYFEEISTATIDYGVITIAKPINRSIFWTTLKYVTAVYNKFNRIEQENRKLKQKIEDIKLVDKAKCILIEFEKLSEEDAHKFIEKQAMDSRSTRREVAKTIISKYK